MSTPEESLGPAEWSLIRVHLKRDAVIVVSNSLDLMTTAKAVAENDVATVQHWLEKQLLAKPTSAQQKEWDQRPSKRFLSIIVQPYVLIQELRS